jgi:hypothetical protein
MKKFLIILILIPKVLLATPDESPNRPWPSDMFHKLGLIESKSKQKRNWFQKRAYDFIDTFRLDAGVGLAAGFEIRPTEYLQLGYRKFNPGSFRVGNFGRRKPYLKERLNQKGFSLHYEESPERINCDLELGFGIDLIIPGIYGAICPVEILDFLFGIVGYDMLEDD